MFSFNYKKGMFKITERVGQCILKKKKKGRNGCFISIEILFSKEEISRFLKPKSTISLLLSNYLINLI